MPATPTFATLADTQTWLGTLVAGNVVSLGSANFTPAIAGQVFKVLPGSDPLSLTVVSADAHGGALTATATVVGEAGCTIKVGFAADTDDPLLVTLEVDLPPDTTWNPVEGFNFGFGGLSATIAPDADVGAATFAFAGNLMVSGEPALSAQLTLPAVPDGDWTLDVAGTTKPSQGLLNALAGGNDPLAVIGNGFGLENFTLSGFTMAFSPKGGVSMFTLALAYHTSWKPFGTDVFEITGFEFDLDGFKPFKAANLEATAIARTKIADVPIDVSVKFPDAAIFAYLDASASLSVTKVFQGFHVELPAGFPEIEISTLSFGIYAIDQAINFTLGIDKPIPITDSIHFDQFHFDLLIAYQDNAFSGHGDLLAQFSFGTGPKPTVLLLQGEYDSSGSLSLACSVANLDVGHIIDSIAGQFKIDRSKIPGAIDSLVLDLLTVSFSRQNGVDSFNFLCKGHTQVADKRVEFAPFLTVTYHEDTKAWELDVGGTLDLIDDIGKMEFKVEFVKKKTDTSFTATYTSTGPLTFKRIGGIFGVDIHDVPSDLDLDLIGLGISYDFTAGNLVIGAQSSNKNYGTSTFLSQAPANTQPRQNIFLLKTGVELSLSQLPLVGGELAKIGTVALKELAAAIATPAPVAKEAVSGLNASIAPIGAQYPTVPADGLAGRLLLSATLELSGSAPKPVSVSLLGPSQHNAMLASAAPIALAAGAAGTTVWFQVQKTFGPVSIQKVGLRYANNKLWALMNAELKAGPVDFSVIGLGIGSALSKFAPDFTVDGITLSIAAGPATFSGALVGQLSPDLDLYGELALTLPSFSIGVLGGYANYQGHPSCFIYGVLDAELGGPPFFFITGLAAGFGFNRTLVIPPIAQLAQFPLISWATGAGPSSTPTGDVGDQVEKAMTQLSQSGVIAPAIGEYWIAAGVQFTSFELINSFALLTVKLGNEVEIDLLGLSTLTLPPKDPEPIAVAQLALDASFAPARSEISVLGQLTSASYVLSKSCHLTGGFAFCMWYGGDNAGDFVVSLGGYSPRYDKPPHYPAVPRLGLNWQITDNLSISGDEYFALTPSAVMAGGGMRAVWSSGAISAWFAVEADFLLLFNPLHYYISASLELGCSVKIDLWFTSFTVSFHLGVQAEIWGPSFSGNVYVDLDIVSFTIGFGSGDRTPPKPIDWNTFVTNVLPSRDAQQKQPPRFLARTARLAPTGVGDTKASPLVQITAPTGMLKTLPPVDGATLPLDWLVDGELLTLTITSTVPLRDHTFSDDGNLKIEPDPNDHGQPNLNIGVGPSNLKPEDLTSTLAITVGALADEGTIIYATQILSSVPKAVWEQRTLDPNGVPNVDPMSGTTVDNALTGYTLTPQTPKPQTSLEILIRNLAFTDVGPQIPIAWSAPVVSTTDPFTDETVHHTITDQLATGNRDTLIKAINLAGFTVDPKVDVSSLADVTAGALLGAPELRYLGEAR